MFPSLARTLLARARILGIEVRRLPPIRYMAGFPFRRSTTLLDRLTPTSPLAGAGVVLPIPHRTLPSPRGEDHDFITVFHSHLTRSDFPNLLPLAPLLTPFRLQHLLLLLRLDPVLSLSLHRFSLLHAPASAHSLHTHSILLHILARSRRFRSAASLLQSTLIPSTHPDLLFDALLATYRLSDSSPAAFDALFKSYAHLRKFRCATAVFRRMRDHGLLPTVRSCNAFIAALLSLGRADIALSFYREMSRCRISPNTFTANMVISALCTSNKLDKAVELLNKMESMGLAPTIASYNTLIAAYCKAGLMAAAVKLKAAAIGKSLYPNAVTYNTLIHGFCKEGRLHEANKVFSEMRAAFVEPNTVTYNTLIHGYSRINNSEMGTRLHEEMVRNGVEVNIATYNALILGLCNEGKTRRAAYMVKQLDSEKLVPNASTYSALISGQCKRENSERAFEVYKVMKRSGCDPNRDTFTLLISTFCKNRDFEGAVEVLRDMLERFMAPDEALLAEIFEGLSSSRKSHLVTKLLSEVNVRRLIPEGLLYRVFSGNQSEIVVKETIVEC